MKNNGTKRTEKLWLVIFAAVFALGLAVGAAVQKGERISSLIIQKAESTVSLRISGETVAIFLDSLMSYAAVLLTVFLLGIKKTGSLLNILFILFLGLGKGALISGIVCDSGVHGLLFTVLVLLPGTVAAVCSVLMLASLSARLCFAGDKKHGKQRLKALLIYTFFIIFSAGLDAVFSVLYRALA